MPLSRIKPEQYQALLTDKSARIKQQFAAFNPAPLQVFDSPPLHFRLRAEFKIWHEGDDTFYAMFNRERPKLAVRVDQLPIASLRINQLMPALMAEILASELLRKRLFQVEFLNTLSGQTLVTMIYHKPLDQQWQQLAEQLQKSLSIKLIGRSKKQRLVLSQDYVDETLQVDTKAYHYQQIENSFTQPNGQVNQKMLTWALQNSNHCGGDLLELYCGNGNFTVVLAQNFRQVLATEISKSSVKSALLNFNTNGVENAAVVRMSSEDISSALAGVRQFNRLKDIDLQSYDFSTVFVDPPRAGLDQQTLQLVSGFNNILYISCNPDTLHDNLSSLCQSHRISQFALFDQFPYTDHVECGVLLTKIVD